jgi:hypothetical protein
MISDDFCRKTLAGILHDAGFEVHELPVSKTTLKDHALLEPYDLIILNNDMVEGVEEEVFSFILAAKGFLLVDAALNRDDFPAASSRYVNPSMSPEEIVSRANSVVFRQKDIRKSPRISVNIVVEYVWQQKRFQSDLQNLSMSGAFIASLNPLPRDAVIDASFSLQEGGRTIRTVCRVLYSIGYDLDRGIIKHPSSSGKKIIAMPGMGVVFETISEEDRESIRRFVDENLF